jgi:AraC-like DNA-binding protein
MQQVIEVDGGPRFPGGSPPAALIHTGMAALPAATHSVGRRQRSWAGVGAVLTELRCHAPFDATFVADRDQLVVMLVEVGGRVEMRPQSGGIAARPRARQPLSLIPAGLPVRGRSETIRLVCHLVLALDLAALGRLRGDGTALPAAFGPRLMFADPNLLRLAELFADACADTTPGGALYGDSLSLALLACLLKLDGTVEPPARGGLAAWQLRAATEYLEETLDGDLRLQDLADRVGLSCSYFSRGFRQATGLAPHQWVVRARVDRAQRLLLDSTLSLAEIALSLGFCDQAHFTRTFSKAVGASPGAWRRAHRPVMTSVALRGPASGLADHRPSA